MERVLQNPARKAKRFAIFNHKGGVGKTTLTVNIAAAAAAQGKRVLLIDSDPQCNMTSYLVADELADQLLNESDGPKGRTIWSAVKPIVDGDGGVNIIDPIKIGENLFLIPGDIRLSDFERELNDLFALCAQRRARGYRGTTALSTLVGEIVKKHKIDFVFYDSGPNIGPLNRTVLLDCDFFIVPVACDLFSLRALQTLGHTLKDWISEWSVITRLAPQGAPLLPGRPAFFGYIPQQYRIYARAISRNHQEYLRQIQKDMRTKVANVLSKLDSSLALPATGSQIGSVRDFGTIIATSQREGLAIWDVSSPPNELAKEVREAFAQIAQKIIKRAEG